MLFDSLLDAQEALPSFCISELYKEIPTDLPPQARLRKLFHACLAVCNLIMSI